jgi:hypothetical protein
MKKIAVVFGALAPPLHEQLCADHGLLHRDQRDADAISRMGITGLLTEAETRRIRMRLLKRIAARLDRASWRKP